MRKDRGRVLSGGVRHYPANYDEKESIGKTRASLPLSSDTVLPFSKTLISRVFERRSLQPAERLLDLAFGEKRRLR